ncbi:hypothetical protein C8R44DRAFT_788347 [Mycena epipterygia]|nr:hypothetical protein C8R44DRAFT_788347 [Mycena epipterygia]
MWYLSPFACLLQLAMGVLLPPPLLRVLAELAVLTLALAAPLVLAALLSPLSIACVQRNEFGTSSSGQRLFSIIQRRRTLTNLRFKFRPAMLICGGAVGALPSGRVDKYPASWLEQKYEAVSAFGSSD